jgi:hypothetical protein
MIHPRLSALFLLSLLSSASLAATENEPDPPSLTELTLPADGPVIDGWLEASYNDFADNFAVGRNRIRVGGDFNDYGYVISMSYDDESKSIGLRDAYATAEYVSMDWTFGQFRAPTTSGHLVTESQQFFMDRTGFGGGGLRQTGLMASGSFDSFGWALAVMDDEGVPVFDPLDDEVIIGQFGDGEDVHARVTFDVIGSSKSDSEGSYDLIGTTNLSVAAAVDNGDSGDTTYIEGTWNSGPFWAHAELADTETGSPLTLSATYMINTQYEVGARSEDPDDGTDATASLAVSRYISGHNCKWTIQLDDGDDYDSDGSEDQRISAGFLVGF